MNLKLLSAASALALTSFAAPAIADEGMWTFDNFPSAQVEAAYGVKIDRRWLDTVQAASVRLTSGCSASVVSGEGLVLTNDHCVIDCQQALSTAEAEQPLVSRTEAACTVSSQRLSIFTP
jgi:hypothetical protein